MDDVQLVRDEGGAFSWHCEKCHADNAEPRSFLGEARCQRCGHLSFVTEVLR